MNKELDLLKQQAAELLAKIERLEAQPAKKKSLLSRPKAAQICQRISYDTLVGINSVVEPYRDRGTFTPHVFVEPFAEDYAKAFNNFFALRHCEGSEPAKEGVTQFVLQPNPDTGELGIYAITEYTSKLKRNNVWFATSTAAREAIKNVGEANILHMMRAFSGIFEG